MNITKIIINCFFFKKSINIYNKLIKKKTNRNKQKKNY